MSGLAEEVAEVQREINSTQALFNTFANKLIDLNEKITAQKRKYDLESDQLNSLNERIPRCELFLLRYYGSGDSRVTELKREHQRLLGARSKCQRSIIRALLGIEKAKVEHRRFVRLLRDANTSMVALNRAISAEDDIVMKTEKEEDENAKNTL